MDLADQAYKLPSALSGGQQQRVAIARALANDPPIIIADEPTGNLDSKTAEQVFELFNNLVSQGKTIIIVTHDSSLAKRTHRTALITDGEIVNEYLARALPTLTNQQLLLISRKIKPRQYDPGAIILSEGKERNTFYVVSKGLVDIVLPRPKSIRCAGACARTRKIFRRDGILPRASGTGHLYVHQKAARLRCSPWDTMS